MLHVPLFISQLKQSRKIQLHEGSDAHIFTPTPQLPHTFVSSPICSERLHGALALFSIYKGNHSDTLHALMSPESAVTRTNNRVTALPLCLPFEPIVAGALPCC